MKKIFKYIAVALAVVAAASCAKEQLLEPESATATSGKKHTVTISLAGTKTVYDNGKTVWEGDEKILISNGTASETIELTKDTKGVGTGVIEYETALEGTLCVIYPASAAAATPMTGGKVNVVVPVEQTGDFRDANIAVAMSDNYQFNLRNVTALIAVDVKSGVDGFFINASGNTICGPMAIDSTGLSGGRVQAEVLGSAGMVSVNTAGEAGIKYVAVAPGEYNAGLTMTALSLEGKFQSKKTTASKVLGANNLVRWGTIGDSMQSLEGEGSESDPYKINNIGELTAFAFSVNLGNRYEGKYVKIMKDIEGSLTSPIGYYLNADSEGAFAGYFDGDNHVVNLELTGDQAMSQNYVAMFGVVDKGSIIKNVKVTGSVEATGTYTAGIIAYARGGESENNVKVENCVSSATVKGGERTGGVLGYGTYAFVDNCANEGAVTGLTNVGGVIGYAYRDTITNVVNRGPITATKSGGGYYARLASSLRVCYLDGTYPSDGISTTWTATGGVAGFVQNSTLTAAQNTAEVSGVSKIGGVAGLLYWSAIENCSNTANVTASAECAGGVVSYMYVKSDITNCTNTGNVSAPGVAGGVLGFFAGGNSYVRISYVNDCENKGNVITTEGIAKIVENNINFTKIAAAGGIVGYVREIANGSATNTTLGITRCVNRGEVTSAASAVGGIVGFSTTPASNTASAAYDMCENYGNVTGYQGVGGILGHFFSRYTHGRKHIRNCMNEGTITTTIATKEARLGGIAGYIQPIYPEANRAAANAYLTSRSQIYNCYNKGNLVCKSDSSTFVGGLVGRGAHIIVSNAYNGGKITNADGKPFRADAAYVGALVGGIYGPDDIDNAYAMKGVAVVGSGAEATEALIGFSDPKSDGIKLGDVTAFCDEKFAFEGSLTYKENDYDTLIPILNAWVGESENYYKWGEGPVFVKPQPAE